MNAPGAPAMKGIGYIDPYGRERECGLSRLKLINLAKREGWPMRRIYGCLFIGARAYRQWLHSQPFIRRNGPVFTNVNTGLRMFPYTEGEG